MKDRYYCYYDVLTPHYHSQPSHSSFIVKSYKRRHDIYPFTKEEVEKLKPLVDSYHEMLKSNSIVECSVALETLLDVACTTKDIDPSIKENGKQMKFQLLSCGELQPFSKPTNATKSNTCDRVEKVVFDGAFVGPETYGSFVTSFIFVGIMLCGRLEEDHTVHPSKRQSCRDGHKFRPRRFPRSQKKSCTSGRNSRKKDGRSRRYYKSRVAAGAKRSRNVMHPRVPRRVRQQIRRYYKEQRYNELNDSLQIDLLKPGAFTDRDMRDKYERLRRKIYVSFCFTCHTNSFVLFTHSLPPYHFLHSNRRKN